MNAVSFFNYGINASKKPKVKLLVNNRDNLTKTGEDIIKNNIDNEHTIYEFDNSISKNTLCDGWSDYFVLKDSSLTHLTESNYKITLDPQLLNNFNQSGYISFADYVHSNTEYTTVEGIYCVDNHQLNLTYVGISKNPNVTKLSELELVTNYCSNVTIELEDAKEYYIYYMGFFNFQPIMQGSSAAEDTYCNSGCGSIGSLVFKKPKITIEKL